MSRPARGPSAHDTPTLGDAEHVSRPSSGPARIGPYRLDRILGEGGFGVVYLAQQASPQRNVAVKLLRSAVVGPQALSRFAYESETLGRLHHPGIAQVYEAGFYDPATGHTVVDPAAARRTGSLPYFAMEYVEGLPLTRSVATRNLDRRSRLNLFIQVCEAVQHAHTKGVIHRDLKPANILVDHAGRPKVLDFGVARVTADDEGGTRTLQTDVGQMVGTLGYMSPEQVAGNPAEVDTRADVYALGVILYELLTGTPPHRLEGRLLHEITRTICEEAPSRLATIDRSLRGDLDTIVAKAMEKDRGRRYQSAAELAADLRRFLADEPIVARPPSSWYQARKFARRNKALVSGMLCSCLVLVAGVVASSYWAVRATHAEAVARDEAATATLMNDFLVGMLGSVDPERAQGREITVMELLDDAAATAGQRLGARPPVEAAVRATLGQSYKGLGKTAKAEEQLLASVDRFQRAFGPDDRNTLNAKRNLAGVYGDAGKLAEAEELSRQTLEAYNRLYGEHDPDAIVNLAELGAILQQATRFQEAESCLRTALERGRRVRGERDESVLMILHNLGTSLKDQGRLDEAEAMLREALALRESVHGPDHPQTLYTVNNLAAVLLRSGKNTQAEPLLRRALDGRRAILGESHPSTLVAMNNLATSLVPQGKLDEAERIMKFVYETNLRDQGEEHAKTLVALGVLAYINEDLGRSDEAERLYLKAIEIRKRARGGADPETWPVMNNLATFYTKWGRYPESEKLFREVIELTTATLPPDHPFTAIFRSNFGECLTRLAKFEEGEATLTAAYPILEKKFGPGHERTTKAAARLADLYTAWGKPELAAEWRGKAGPVAVK